MATHQTTSLPYVCHHCGERFGGRKRKYCVRQCATAATAAKKRQAIDQDRKKPFKPKRTPSPIIDGMRVCIDCGNRLPLSAYKSMPNEKCVNGKTIRSVCLSCEKEDTRIRGKRRNPENRIAERSRMAEKRGKQYRPGGAAARAVPFSVLQSRVAKQNAIQAWDWWMVNAPDEWVAAYWEATGEPWRNRRLSETEKYRIQYRLDPVFNLKERLRQQARKQKKRARTGEAIRSTIRRNGRAPSLEKMFGYTIPELKAHLERQFTKRMNWDRFLSGEIHIDHIHPQSKFDLSDDEQWKRCWCLSNLRPLWARDNLEKHNRVLFLV